VRGMVIATVTKMAKVEFAAETLVFVRAKGFGCWPSLTFTVFIT
jgi:hypothetical protein